MKWNTIIWDWNGTLLNDLDVCVDVMNDMLEKRNLPKITVEIYQSIFNFPVIEYYEALGFDFQKEDYRVVAKEFIDAYNAKIDCCRLQTSAYDALQNLKQLGIRQVVLSAMEQENLNMMLNRFGLTSFFDFVIGTTNIFAESKVEKGAYLLKQLNIDPEQICLIGDTLHDRETALHIQCSCILVANGHHSFERLQKKKTHVISDLTQLMPYLNSFQN